MLDIIGTMVALYKEHSAPVYLFDCDELTRRVAAIQSALPGNCTLCYAVKANPFLVRYLFNSNAFVDNALAANTASAHPLKAEACSRGELELCLADGVPSAQIVFSGVMKTGDDIRRAMEAGVGTITLESIEQAKMLLEQSAITKSTASVILRLGSGSQFGMSETDYEECLKLLSANPAIKVMGVHYFTGTQKRIAKTGEEIAMISAFAKSHNFDLVEYGAGAYYEYYGKQERGGEQDAENVQDAADVDEVKRIASLIESANSTQGIKSWVIELGRYIAAPVGYYITRIMDVKEQYVICDGGINHVNYYGSMVGMKKPRVIHVKTGKSNGENVAASGVVQEATSDVQKYTVCGSLCTFNDVLVRSIELDRPAVGDYLVFCDIGAYSVTESMYLFLSHTAPAVYEMCGGKAIIRRRPMETYMLNH